MNTPDGRSDHRLHCFKRFILLIEGGGERPCVLQSRRIARRYVQIILTIAFKQTADTIIVFNSFHLYVFASRCNDFYLFLFQCCLGNRCTVRSSSIQYNFSLRPWIASMCKSNNEKCDWSGSEVFDPVLYIFLHCIRLDLIGVFYS